MTTPAKKTSKLKTLAENLQRKTRSLRNGGLDADNDHQVGLVPSRGWSRRNIEFVGKVLLPGALKRREGQHRSFDSATIPHHHTRVVWIGHASFLIQMGGWNVLVDPNWALWLAVVKRARQPGLAIKDLPRIDLVLVTHAHHDHLHVPSLKTVACGQPVLVPQGVGSLVKRLGFGPVHEMKKWETMEFPGLEVTFTPARHWGARYVHDTHRGFGGFFLRSPDAPSVYHCGDSAYFDGFHEIGRRLAIDVALMPIGAYKPVSGRGVHMTPEEALAAFCDLGAKKMIPMHYRTFALTREPLDEPLQRLLLSASATGLRSRLVVVEEGEPATFP